MSILTLARYILEFSLMDYATITVRDSQLASAALYIALRMNFEPPWSVTLEYYTGLFIVYVVFPLFCYINLIFINRLQTS